MISQREFLLLVQTLLHDATPVVLTSGSTGCDTQNRRAKHYRAILGRLALARRFFTGRHQALLSLYGLPIVGGGA